MIDICILQYQDKLQTVSGAKPSLDWDYMIWINTRYSPYKIAIDADLRLNDKPLTGPSWLREHPARYLPKNWTI